MKIFVITDNLFLLDSFVSIIDELSLNNLHDFRYACSPTNELLVKRGCSVINIKKDWMSIINDSYQLIISLHCKQLFPKGLVEAVRCVNIHPGYNPYNRGWYPQVFSIINKMPLGATIHEIDAYLDHGPIIVQKQIELLSCDTSFTAYNKVLNVELELIKDNIVDIIDENYRTTIPSIEGNVNLKKDFNSLLQIDLDETVKVGEFIDKLRALTHGEYANAYFNDKDGNKIYIGLTLSKSSHD